MNQELLDLLVQLGMWDEGEVVDTIVAALPDRYLAEQEAHELFDVCFRIAEALDAF